MKLDRLHYTLAAATAALIALSVYLTFALNASDQEVRKYMAVGAYTLINGQNQALKAAHETRANSEQMERYMTPDALSACRASQAPQAPADKPPAMDLPAVDRAALERVTALASSHSAGAN